MFMSSKSYMKIFEHARDLYFDKKYEDALVIFEDLLKENLDKYLLAETIRRKADCLKNLGRSSEAIELYEKALELASDNDYQVCWILESKANCLASLERFDDALTIYEQLLEKDLDQLDHKHLQDGFDEIWRLKEVGAEDISLANQIKEEERICLELKKAADWTVHFFASISPPAKLTYNVPSIGIIDDFIEALRSNEKVAWKYMDEDLEKVLIAFGAYFGETIINTDVYASWLVNAKDPDYLINAKIGMLDDEISISPIQKVMKRYQKGKEDSLYHYAKIVLGQFTIISSSS